MVFFGLCFLLKHTFSRLFSSSIRSSRTFRQAAFLTAFSESVNYLEMGLQ